MRPLAAALSLWGCLVLTAAAADAPPLPATRFRDPLDVPAAPSPIAARAPMMGAVRTPGGRLVAVGRRGIVVTSDDGGATWAQARVPVSTDLEAVQFPTAKQGWAVGHGGVVLHSADGGLSWTKQIDGRRLPALLVAHYAPLADAGDSVAKDLLADARRYAEDGPGRPLLDVWFDDERHGTVVGAYDLALRTDDGGATWHVIGELLPNPQGLHLYGITTVDGISWIAGEQGLLMRGDPYSGRYEKVETPYPGTFFGLAGMPGELLLFGLRGHALRSTDGGATWATLATATQGSLVSGALLPGRRIALAGLGGEVMEGDGRGEFAALPLADPVPWYHVADAGNGALVLAGARGVRVVRSAIPSSSTNR